MTEHQPSIWEDPEELEKKFEECIKINGDTLELDFSIFDQPSETQTVDVAKNTAMTSTDDKIETDNDAKVNNA